MLLKISFNIEQRDIIQRKCVMDGPRSSKTIKSDNQE